MPLASLSIESWRFFFQKSSLSLPIALINPNTDYDYNKYYLLTHPLYCIKMILKTYMLYGYCYVKQLIGILGCLKIKFVLPIYILTLL